MKKNYFLIFLLLACEICTGQNLVQNPSFENYTTCPNGWAQIADAIGWSSFRETCDYYNACCTTNWGTPSNIAGYQLPHSGNAYAGIIIFDRAASYYREVIGGQLLSPLVIGQKYDISFYTCLSIKSPNNAFASNKIGAKFTTTAYTATSDQIPINNIAPIHHDTIITDTLNWTLVSGSFISDSAYLYIAIGNFFDDTNTDTLRLGNGILPIFAYYYIDDVSVTVDNSGVGINANNSPTNFVSIYPNPVIDKLNVQTNNYEQTEITLYDITSRKLLQQTFTNTTIINTEQLAKDIYIYEIRNKNGIIKKGKIIK